MVVTSMGKIERWWTTSVTSTMLEPPKYRLKNYIKDDKTGGDNAKELKQESDNVLKSRQIDDLFPNTTVMFREASQVFTQIETIYRASNKTAKCRKVKTTGD
jgi:hypothetical protein